MCVSSQESRRGDSRKDPNIFGISVPSRAIRLIRWLHDKNRGYGSRNKVAEGKQRGRAMKIPEESRVYPQPPASLGGGVEMGACAADSPEQIGNST